MKLKTEQLPNLGDIELELVTDKSCLERYSGAEKKEVGHTAK